jgi:HPt (histidine-containing phosphotransfer) domain-containing protein
MSTLQTGFMLVRAATVLVNDSRPTIVTAPPVVTGRGKSKKTTKAKLQFVSEEQATLTNAAAAAAAEEASAKGKKRKKKSNKKAAAAANVKAATAVAAAMTVKVDQKEAQAVPLIGSRAYYLHRRYCECSCDVHHFVFSALLRTRISTSHDEYAPLHTTHTTVLTDDHVQFVGLSDDAETQRADATKVSSITLNELNHRGGSVNHYLLCIFYRTLTFYYCVRIT